MNDEINFILEEAGLTLDEIRSSSRSQNILLMRHYISYYLLAKRYTYQEVGDFVNRDRTTIYNSQKVIRELLSINYKPLLKWKKYLQK